ncbi:uncharacterized protein [Montipora capricornis]|uniref:uncharacterized protein n=1 Tax=Montipora capricornis TaxID=246305 RepID=UPI0035F10C29
MANETNRQRLAITNDTKGKSKSHWRKQGSFLKVGSKDKGHAFVEKRKRIALREYKKLLKKTRNDRIFNGALDEEAERGFGGIPSRQEKANLQNVSDSSSCGTRKRNYQPRRLKSVNRYSAVENDLKKRKLEKEQRIKEREAMMEKHREEVQEKLKKRRETFGRLNRRTRKGQPVMANQIEYLLEKIQSQP